MPSVPGGIHPQEGSLCATKLLKKGDLMNK
jgi:hypothetical protein